MNATGSLAAAGKGAPWSGRILSGLVVLLTDYLGGAVATQVRVGSPIFSHALFGAYLGAIVRGGRWLRGPRLLALIPLRG